MGTVGGRGVPNLAHDLRRLRVHGLIERVPHSHLDWVTDTGLPAAMLLTRAHERLLAAGLAHVTDPAATSTALRTAAGAYQAAIDDLAREHAIAA